MYGALWRVLPGPGWFKAILMLILALGVVYLLFEVVFPWVYPMLPIDDNTIASVPTGIDAVVY